MKRLIGSNIQPWNFDIPAPLPAGFEAVYRADDVAGVLTLLKGAAGPMIVWESPAHQLAFILQDREELRRKVGEESQTIRQSLEDLIAMINEFDSIRPGNWFRQGNRQQRILNARKALLRAGGKPE